MSILNFIREDGFMFFFNILLSLFIYSVSLVASNYSSLELEEENSPRKRIHLLDRKDWPGEENFKGENVLYLPNLSDPPSMEVLFSGKKVNPKEEKNVLKCDERQEIAGDFSWNYPGSCILSLEAQFKDFKILGTAFMIDESLVLTSGYNLLFKDTFPESITCYAGRYKDSVTDFCQVISFSIFEDFFSTNQTTKDSHAYGVLFLEKPMGKFFGYFNPTCEVFENFYIAIQGYPALYYGGGKEKVVNSSCQYRSHGKISINQQDKIFITHNIPTTSGQSGSPLLIQIKKEDHYYCKFVGLHLYGDEQKLEGSLPNKAIRVTKDFLSNLEKLMNVFKIKDSVLQKKNSSSSGTLKARLYKLKEICDQKKKQETYYEKGKKYYEQKDYDRALRAFKNAVEKEESSHASYLLAECYFNGYGTQINTQKAFRWYSKAAEKVHTDALFKLAECYYQGVGTSKDYSKAIILYKKIKDNSADALYRLAQCYYYGYGVKSNYKESKKFCDLAIQKGHPKAQNFLNIYLSGWFTGWSTYLREGNKT